MTFVGIVAALAWLIVPVWIIVLLLRQRAELHQMRQRLDRLEREAAERGAALTAVPAPVPAEEQPPLPPPIPIEVAVEAGNLRAPTTEAAPETPRRAVGRRAPLAPSSMEQLIGGVWLQNVGSVLMLLGVFFLILWGYTSGRLGAPLLVIAGAGLGLGFVWRGDRLTRTVPAFGQALIGIGIGIVYLSLYLGHFTLRVIDTRTAFALLAGTSLATVIVGLRYRAPTIAALGVVGAFLPEVLAVWMPLRGFSIPPGAALAYFAVVDVAVFALAARAGWGMVDLLALALTTITWMLLFVETRWGWGIQLGLTALYLMLGLALLPRLATSAERPRPSEIAVVAVTPLMFLSATWPFFAAIGAAPSAVLLMSIAVVYLLAALWAEPRRDDEDLWRPLTAAATVFLTAALQRAVGSENLAMAWCLEAVALVWLGLHARGWWIRACGYAVGTIGAVTLLGRLASPDAWTAAWLPVLYPAGVRDLVCLAALIAVAALLGQPRARAAEGERAFGKVWIAGVNGLLLLWASREARNVALFTAPDHAARPAAGGRVELASVRMLSAVITSGAWTAQAAVLLTLGWMRESQLLRWLGLGLLGLTVMKFLLIDLQQVEVFWRFLTAIAVGAALLVVSYVYQHRLKSV